MSLYLAIRCDRCDRHYLPCLRRGPHGTDFRAGADRLPAHVQRTRAREEGWRCQVRGIAPGLRGRQGTYDFCPACIVAWDREDAR